MNENIQYPAFWKRCIAWLLDAVMVGIIIFLARLTIAAGGQLLQIRLAGGKTAILSLVIGASIAILYHAILESSVLQATPGKSILGLAVTDLKGRRISFKRALARHLSKYLSGLSLWVGYLICPFTKHKQCLHDMIAKCLVINKISNQQEESNHA